MPRRGIGSPAPTDNRNPTNDPEMARLLAERDRIFAEEDARCPLGQRERTPECEAVQRSRDAQSDAVGAATLRDVEEQRVVQEVMDDAERR